eukprot:241496_1
MIEAKILKKQINDNIKQIIFKFCKQIDDDNNDDDNKENKENINEYYKQMVEIHCNKIKNIKINLFLMNIDIYEINNKLFGYSQLKTLFITDLYDGTFIKLNTFCIIFKNLQKIYIENVNHKQKQEKTLNLSNIFMDNLYNFLNDKSNKNEIKLNTIQISNVNETQLSINNAIKIYNEKFIDINWIICISEKQ